VRCDDAFLHHRAILLADQLLWVNKLPTKRQDFPEPTHYLKK
jgi:hypothetical protein